MNVSVHLKQTGLELPRLAEGETRLVLARSGIFRERRGAIFTTCTRVPVDYLSLDDCQEYCLLACGRIPRIMHRAMLGFFREAHATHGGEAALILLFHPGRRVFRWHCPQQYVDVFWSGMRWRAADRITFDHPLALPEGYVHFGDAHLHPGSPLPSQIDIADERDGLHIIVGNIAAKPTYHVTFVIDGCRFSVKPDLIFRPIDVEPAETIPLRWLQRIVVNPPSRIQ